VALTPTARVRARVRDCRCGGWGDKAERGGGEGDEAEVRGCARGWLAAHLPAVRMMSGAVLGGWSGECGVGFVLVVLLAGPLSLCTTGCGGVPLHPKLARQRRRTPLGCVGRSGRRWALPEGEGRARCNTGCRDRPLA
jgi:hypothetical protein